MLTHGSVDADALGDAVSGGESRKERQRNGGKEPHGDGMSRQSLTMGITMDSVDLGVDEEVPCGGPNWD